MRTRRGCLAEMLADRGDPDELRDRVDAGDEVAGRGLADLLTKQGMGEKAERLRRFGLNPDGVNCLPAKDGLH
jgi:hypothetical protein